MPELREFGERLPGQVYRDRPSAYVILRDTQNAVAIVRTPEGVFLPGGGQDPGETPEQTVVREVAEECGWRAEVLEVLEVVDQFAWVTTEESYCRKRSTFFRGRITGTAPATETDHEVCWRLPDDAMRELSHESHRWAVAEDRRRR